MAQACFSTVIKSSKSTSTNINTNKLYGVTYADFNKDGKIDLVTADPNTTSISLMIGNGIGGFSVPTKILTLTH